MSLPPYDQSVRDFERHFQVVLPDSVGQATVGFRDGVWYRLNSGAPHAVPIRSAIILCPHAAGSIVQIVCWWMRENARASRALDLATELALTVGELARKAIEDDPLGMSLGAGSQSASQGSAPAVGAPALGAGMGSPSPLDANPYNSGAYLTDPYAAPAPAPAPAPSPYEPAYAASTTLIPQITPDMTTPGRSLGGAPRPTGPMPALPAPSPGRPGPAAPGFGAPRGQGPMPGGRPPMGSQPGPASGQQGNWDRADGFDQRGTRPAGPPPRQQQQPGYGPEPRDDFFRGAPRQPRRPEQDEYPGGGRPQQPGRPAQGHPDSGRW